MQNDFGWYRELGVSVNAEGKLLNISVTQLGSLTSFGSIGSVVKLLAMAIISFNTIFSTI